MRILNHKIIHPSRTDLFTLYYLTDTHLGARACDEKALSHDIATIRDNPNALWIGGGDYIDCVARKGDKRYVESTVADWVAGEDDLMVTQADYFLDMTAPIADKCLGLVCGNHEAFALKKYDLNIYRYIVRGIARAKGVDTKDIELGVQGYVNIVFKRLENGSSYTFNIYCHHGYGGGRLHGGHALTLARILDNYVCDVALLGHRHTRVMLDKTYAYPDGKQRTRIGMFVPSYLRTWINESDGTRRLTDTYAEEKGYPPSPIGTTPIIIHPDKRRFWIEYGA